MPEAGSHGPSPSFDPGTKFEEVMVKRYLDELLPKEQASVARTFERVKELAKSYSRRARMPEVADVRMCWTGAYWGNGVLEIGVRLVHRHTWKGLQIIVGHEIGHAKHEDSNPSEWRLSQDSEWNRLNAEFYADGVAMDLCGLTVQDWARGIIGAMKIEDISVADLDCHGDTIALRYDRLLGDAARGWLRMGRAMDFVTALQERGYHRFSGLPPID